jgi:hypothetical protein
MRSAPRITRRMLRARSAAAQAVVAVRMDLPLESADIYLRVRPARGGQLMLSGATATFQKGFLQHCIGALPDAAAAERLTSFAAVPGALCAAAALDQRRAEEALGHQLAFSQMYLVARALGIGSAAEPAARAWVKDRFLEALSLLIVDGQAAWNSVANALQERATLTGEQVRNFIEASDEEQGI